jgi:hypothetical protein
MLLSVIFRIFGTGARGSLAVSLSASIAAAFAFALLPALAVASRLGRSCGVLAGVAGALLPVNYWAQTSGIFDAPFTGAMLVVLCLVLCGITSAASFKALEGLAFGGLGGLACLLNPALVPVTALWSVILVVRYRTHLRCVISFLGISAAFFLLTVAPWAIRNELALGSPIWTRDNFGLELQVSNHDAAIASQERNIETPEFASSHPHRSANERAKVRAMGEIQYNRAKKEQALAWIRSHKRRFVRLTTERLRQFWFPSVQRWWQTTFEATLTILGLGGLWLMIAARNPFGWVFASALIAYPLIYYVIQVSPRYRYPVESLLFYWRPTV